MLIIDCETTGLNFDRHRPFEICIIDVDREDWERWIWRPSEPWFGWADVQALKMNRMLDRVPDRPDPGFERHVAEKVSAIIDGRVIAGSNPDFDVNMLRGWLGQHFLPCTPHYRTIDIPTFAAGRLHSQGVAVTVPIRSRDVSNKMGVEPPDEVLQHTAVADAVWMWRLWQEATR